MDIINCLRPMQSPLVGVVVALLGGTFLATQFAGDDVFTIAAPASLQGCNRWTVELVDENGVPSPTRM
jgi:acyl dehydratase